MKTMRTCIAALVLVSLCAACSASPVHSTAVLASSVQTAMRTDAPLLPTPSTAITAMPALSDMPTPTNAPGLLNEDNFTQYFQFGMSRRDAKKELDNLRIKWSESMYKSDEDVPPDFPEGFWDVTGDGITLKFNNKDQLYYLETTVFDTSRGLCIGDSLDTMHELYGQEDEENGGEYIYHKNGYYFAVDVDENNVVFFWNVFVDIWNGASDSIPSPTTTLPGSDDVVKFNENNVTDYFHFGMSKSSIKKELNKLGVRIDIDYLDIETDHMILAFDDNHLAYIQVNGWETAKGLNTGDSEDKLYQLYGKENRFGDDTPDEKEYIYDLKGYSLIVRVDNCYTHVYGVDCWIVSNNKNIINK